MPTKRCCCCPDCTANPGKCCACIPETICLTFTVYGQDPCSGELDWDRVNKRFSGTVCNHDILLYFERDEYESKCYFKLRSVSLGFPEGYEHEWEVGYEIDCDTLTASVVAGDVTLDIVGVEKVMPDECTGCKCLCECICVTVTYTTQTETQSCTGKLCWDYTQHAYTGTVTCNDEYNTEREVTITLGRRGDYDPYADPYDETCVLVLNIPSLGIVDEWTAITDCQRRAFPEEWTGLEGPEQYSTVDVSFRCAECNEECANNVTCKICEETPLPRTLTVSIYRSSEQTTCENLEFVDSFEITNPGPPDPIDEDCWEGSHVYSEPGGDVSLTVTFCCAHPAHPTPSWNTNIAYESDSASGNIDVIDLTCDPFMLRYAATQLFGPDTNAYCIFITL